MFKGSFDALLRGSRDFAVQDFQMFRIGIRRFATTNVLRSTVVETPAGTSVTLNWVEYLKMKKQLHRINTGVSILTGFTGAFATLTYLGNVEIDVEKTIFGFDPMMVMAAAVLLGGGVGYLLGGFIGRPVFNMINRTKIQQFKVKDRQFLERIKANRADPLRSLVANPVPDYYGEKIYTLNDYKQWLRDCNAFKRKATEFL